MSGGNRWWWVASWVALVNGCDSGGSGSAAPQVQPDLAPKPSALVLQVALAAGDATCFAGGIRTLTGLDADGDGRLTGAEVAEQSVTCQLGEPAAEQHFNRIATFAACLQPGVGCAGPAAAAEIVAASSDGNTLIYTDAPGARIGFVDITEPAAPVALGALAMGGEPTSVTVVGGWALVAVDTSTSFTEPSGRLALVDIASRAEVRSWELGGQPDSIAVSPDGAYLAIVIENQRDEELGDGAPPQPPAGELVVVSLHAAPDDWQLRRVDLTGLDLPYPGDPEPEYVDINSANQAVVTLQENNDIVLVDLASAAITASFSAGSVDLERIDTQEESPARIELSGELRGIAREPDGVAWINDEYFATADEGDLDGGSRGFTVFNTAGEVVYSSGNELDTRAISLGQYPDARSGNKGNEPENIELGAYGAHRYLFVASERASLIFVYDVADPARPQFKQVLPAAAAPEGVLAIPARNLLIAASEEEDADGGLRAGLNIYQYQSAPAPFPTLASEWQPDVAPLPWGALSGLAADPAESGVLYSVHDSYYAASAIYRIDTGSAPAQLTARMQLRDANGVLSKLKAARVEPGTDSASETRAAVFDSEDLKALLGPDHTVNLDLEGIARASDGGFWLVSEGAGTQGDAERPIDSVNLLLKADANGVIEAAHRLPAEVEALQVRFGFEGVTEAGGRVVVALQRAWQGEAEPRIAVFNPADECWTFYFYPLDRKAEGAAGWVGLSDITALSDTELLVLERDNQAGPAAAIKRLYKVDLSQVPEGGTLSKTLVRDLMPDITAFGNLPPEKLEGLAVTAKGEVFVVNDNDGVDGNSGETWLINLGDLSRLTDSVMQ